MVTINTDATRAAAIGVAARRVEITRKERDHALHRVNEETRGLAEAQEALDRHEAELRLETFTLDALIAEATTNGRNLQYLNPLNATEKGKDEN